MPGICLPLHPVLHSKRPSSGKQGDDRTQELYEAVGLRRDFVRICQHASSSCINGLLYDQPKEPCISNAVSPRIMSCMTSPPAEERRMATD